MAIFQKSPEKTLQRRDAAIANRDRLAARLTEAEDAVIASKSAAQRAALDGDDGRLDSAEVAESAALRRLSTITAAHTEAEQVLLKLEGQIAAKLDETTRAATAAETNAIADELIQAGAAYDASTALLAEVSNRALAITAESHGLCVFTSSSRIEVAAAVEVVAAELRQHGRAVLNGLAKAEMPKPAAPAAKPVAVVKAPPLVTVFATKPLRWLDDDGKQRACGKYVDIDLPAATAKRALACGVALELTNPARKANLGTWPGHYSLAHCFDLDAAAPTAEGAPQQHDPVVHSAFQVVDRGKPFQLRIAGAK